MLTYNALEKYIASYAAPVWSTNIRDSSYKKIQTAQNAALRTATEAHKMASIDHLHQDSLTLKVMDRSDMLSAQYLVNCLEEDHVCHGITKPIKKTLHSRHHSTVLPRLGTSRKESLRNLHTHAVESANKLLGNNRDLRSAHPNIGRATETEPKTTMQYLPDQNTAIYCKTTSIGCSENQATSVQTVQLHCGM